MYAAISRIRSALLAAFVAAVVVACQTVPGTGRSQLILVQGEDLQELGLSEFEKIKKNTPISKDPQANALIERVGRRIAAVAPVENAKWEFVLFDKPDVANAFALPGGKVGVYSGLLDVTKSEAGLATVMAHEVAHVVARHGAERLSEGLLLQLGGQALAVATRSQPEATQALIHAAYGIGANVGVMLPHSRKQELEADQLGLLYMARAGYDPREAVEFWKRFAQKKGDKRSSAFLSTHPLDEDRIAQLNELMPKALAEYQKARAGR